MLVLWYPKCSTCQKAVKWLEDNGLEFELRDIKTNNPNLNELSEWYDKSGLDIKRFFNTSGLMYKAMNLKDRLPVMSEKEKLELLSTDGMLVKRPLVISDKGIYTGFKEKEWEKLK